MNKRITFELTQEQYDALCKLWEQAKKATFGPSKALNFDDFCKEIVVTFAQGPNLSEMLDTLNLEDVMSSMGDISQLKDMLASMKKSNPKPKEEKKKDAPDDEKYKS